MDTETKEYNWILFDLVSTDMKIPVGRRRDVEWLKRNLQCYNSHHNQYAKAMEILRRISA